MKKTVLLITIYIVIFAASCLSGITVFAGGDGGGGSGGGGGGGGSSHSGFPDCNGNYPSDPDYDPYSGCSDGDCGGGGSDGGGGGGGYVCEPGACVLGTCPQEGNLNGYGNYPISCSGSDGCNSCSVGNAGTSACGVPTCNPKEGYTLQLEKDAEINSKCAPSLDRGEFGGTPDCVRDPAISNPNRAECSTTHNTNGLMSCYHIKTCAQIAAERGTDYVTEYVIGDPALANHVFIADPEGSAGQKGYICGKYVLVKAPYWQTARGNLYAQEAINRNTDRSDQYVISAENTTCPALVDTGAGQSAEAGIQQIGSDSASHVAGYNVDPGVLSYATQRTTTRTAAYSAFRPDSQKQDFAYFAGLINYADLPSYPQATSMGEGANISQIYKFEGNAVVSHTGGVGVDIDLSSLSGTSRVIFVNGNLDFVSDAKITTPEGNYLAFIVSGTVTIPKELGDEMTTGCNEDTNCATAADAHIQAVIIANNITIEKSDKEVNALNPDAFCDRRLILAGTYVSWNGDLDLGRTFKGCGLPATPTAEMTADYPDCNLRNPGVSVFYRPDFFTNSPEWMDQLTRIRTEEI